MMDGLILIEFLVISLALSDMAVFLSEVMSDVVLEKRPKGTFWTFVVNSIIYILSCKKCFSFWLTLVSTGNIFTAAAVSIGVKAIDWLIGKLTNKTEID